MKFLKNFMIFSFILITSSLIVINLLAFQAKEEFQVNTTTGGNQGWPAIAMDAKGNFVIVWQSVGIFAQRFNRKGKAIGPEFQVNTTTGGSQGPAIAMDAKGNFVITWECSAYAHGFLFARMYNSKGEAIGPEFQVNTHTESCQYSPAIAMDAKGNFVITWYSTPTGGDIFARRFNRKGKAIGEEFRVNTYTKSHQLVPAVAMDAKWDFVITWHSNGQDGSVFGVFAQMYNRKGKAIGPEFQVNTYTDGKQLVPAVAMDAKRNFVITWMSAGQDGSVYGIFAQKYNRKGKAIGKEFRVNSYTKSSQDHPAIAMDKEGNFVITWVDSSGRAGSGCGVFAQRYNSKGEAIGPEFQVNTSTEGSHTSPAIAMDKKGNFVITWQTYGQDGSEYGIFAQRFNKKGQPIGNEFQV